MALEDLLGPVGSRVAARLYAEEILVEYADAIDRGDFDAWAKMFDDDEGSYRLAPRGNIERGMPLALIDCPTTAWVRDRATSILHASVYSPHGYRHVYGNISARERADGRVATRAHYAVYRTSADGDTDLFSVGSLEALLLRDGAAPILAMDVTYDTVRIPGLLVFPI